MKTSRNLLAILLAPTLAVIISNISYTHSALAQGEISDPYDSEAAAPASAQAQLSPEPDKSAEELLDDAIVLLQDERPLDARTKLLQALKKDPKEFKAHMMLANYYLVHVGHFRLALRYLLRAQELFEEKNGKPPYYAYQARRIHEQLLYSLSQVRLNLDDYVGSLRVLDEYASYGYSDDWYAGSRAWVLMKLGRVDEAIKVAKLGIKNGSEPGRTLNMLGILLSMSGDRLSALDVFKEAIRYELSMGKMGAPATPLNNSGEVYKEIFQEQKAQSSWQKAISMPDGCEHVLPALNLALLYIEQLELRQASHTMDNFLGCVAQFPLRNGEEHRALVELIRGRLDLHSGHPAKAIPHLQKTLEDRQWFGKIGTTEDDLRVGAMISLAQAEAAAANHMKTSLSLSVAGRLERIASMLRLSLESWWHLRRASQILIDDLSSMEDIYVRNTDSMIEYPTLGDVLKDIPTSTLRARLRKLRDTDNRGGALPYYELYMAENLSAKGSSDEAKTEYSKVITNSRPDIDALLRLRATTQTLALTPPNSPEYNSLAQIVFLRSAPALRNAGLPLPVNSQGVDSDLASQLSDTNFTVDNTRPLDYSIVYKQEEDGQHLLMLVSNITKQNRASQKGQDLRETINKLNDETFSTVIE